MCYMAKEYRRIDHLFCVSETTKTEFCKQFPGTAEKASVFYNLLDAQEIIEKAREPVSLSMKPTALVTVGRISKPKGQILIPETVRLLLDAGYSVYWYLVGDGEMRGQVESEIKKYGVGDHVILLGTQTNPYPYIQNCDIYVQPSFSEGYCTTTMEAKILHKPIVTTDAPGMREQFVSGENGIIIRAMTSESLFDGIKQLLDTPDLAKHFSDNLRAISCDHQNEITKLYDLI